MTPSLRILCVAALCSATVSAQPPAKVATAKVRAVEHVPTLELLGEARAFRTGRCSAQTAGLVTEIAVVEGLDVSTEGAAVTLDTSTLEIRKQEAEAELQLVKEQLAEYEAGSRPEEIREKREALAEAEALLERAEDELRRVKKLMTTGAATTEDEIRARLAVAAARAVVARRQADLDLVLAGPRKELIARTKAQVRIREARLAGIVDDIEKALIPAPFAARVTEKMVGVGDYVQPGTVLFELVQLNPIKIEILVPEKLVPSLAPGKELTVTIDALPGETFDGVVEGIVPRALKAGRSFPTRLLVTNDGFRILPGMLARTKLPAGKPVRALSVPGDALVNGPAGPSVFVVRDGKAMPVPVEPLAVQAEWVPVKANLEVGEAVVTRGNERLRPGQAVIVLPDQSR